VLICHIHGAGSSKLGQGHTPVIPPFQGGGGGEKEKEKCVISKHGGILSSHEDKRNHGVCRKMD